MGGKTPRLTKNSSAVQLSRAKIENKEISVREEPRAAWSSEADFRAYPLANFRTRCNALREQLCEEDGTLSGFLQCDIIFLYFSNYLLYGVVLSSELAAEDGKVLNRRTSQSDLDGGSKRARIAESALEHSNMEPEDSAWGAGAELTMSDHVFEPLYLISSWLEPKTTTRRLSLAINLPMVSW